MTEHTAQSARITRVQLRFERDFTQLPNAWLRDRRLSRGARGLLAELMTHDTSSYQITLDALSGAGLEGRDALRRMVSELERYGYLHRVQKRRAHGRMAGHDWVIQDPFEGVDEHGASPLLAPVDNPRRTASDYPTSAKPTSAPPSSVKPTPIEDQVKNKDHVPAQPQGTMVAPVDNLGAVRWSDERCPANYRNGAHELGHYGKCVHCAERPLALRSAS
ncbi:hypothetical protein [Microbacterium sp. TNHR37B]|uniref:hypothetical protein n=1 Tax=Microbacterium sp. TNHR37B TaxID=1775956 RepID=UPI0012FC4335|nr:hypothetical protein [Microbacterium sp. TNHR37B]